MNLIKVFAFALLLPALPGFADCDEIRQRLDEIHLEIELAQADLHDLPPSMKPALLKEIKELRAEAMSLYRQARLENCEV